MTSDKQPDIRTKSDDSKPLQFSEVIAEEYSCIHSKKITPNTGDDTEEKKLTALYKQIHEGEWRRALCFSGGGIRSATFCLGVIQALAKKETLDKFHYLSTVSGGGYIGSWLSAWISRTTIDEVSKELAKPASPLAPEAAPIAWIRAYSNYLSPKLGLFSGDSLALIGTYLRNVTLNWLILIPFLLALLLLPRLYISIVQWSFPVNDQWILFGMSLLLGLIALTYVHLYRPSLVANRDGSSPIAHQSISTLRQFYCDLKRKESSKLFTWWCLVPFTTATLFLTINWTWYVNTWKADPTSSANLSVLCFGLVTAGLHFLSWLLSGCWLFYPKQSSNEAATQQEVPMYKNPWWWFKELIAIIVSGFIGGLFLWALHNLLLFRSTDYAFAEWYTCVAPLFVIGTYLIAATIFIGFASQYTREEDREWWGRAGSWMLAMGFGWLALAGIVILVPAVIVQLPGLIGPLGGMSGLLALYLGFSSKTRAQDSEANTRTPTEVVLSLLPKLSAPIFVIILLGLLALGTSKLLEFLKPPATIHKDISVGLWGVPGPVTLSLPSTHFYALHDTPLELLVMVLACSLALSFLMARFVNINTFSLHALYRNRLVRAYLGASRTKRNANPFSGFDADDNQELKDLVQKPFHIINAALNLVHSENIAWQERKAHSFTMSPLHCGSAVPIPKKNENGQFMREQLGYRYSKVYGKQKEGAGGKPITLGTALAISGAAASPNMGYHTSAPVAFLLTLFNIRLGWWLGNPGRAGEEKLMVLRDREDANAYRSACPGFALFPLLAEAFGFTDASHPYVYLSDGGHFENLGLYEMVLRRCHLIVVVDAGCDPEHKFTDLGNAIRKIRADLGIEITINLKQLQLQSDDRLQYAVGEIHYDSIDRQGKDVKGKNGFFLYLKPSLTGEEPADVLQYRAEHKDFPHESTVDQFFSESQFESYRKLGKWIAEKAIESLEKDPKLKEFLWPASSKDRD